MSVDLIAYLLELRWQELEDDELKREKYDTCETLPGLPQKLFRYRGSTNFRDLYTANGYCFDLVKSALQKYIRRGESDKACTMAAEADLFRWMPGGKAALTNLKHRLQIIYLEDIGLADVGLLFRVDELLDKWQDGLGWELSVELTTLVREMALTNHSRMYSHLNHWAKQMGREEQTAVSSSPLQCPLVQGESRAIQDSVNRLFAALKERDLPRAWQVTSCLFFTCEELLKNKYPTGGGGGKGRSKRPGYLIFALLEWWERYRDPFRNKDGTPSSLWSRTIDICRRWYHDGMQSLKESFLTVLHPIAVFVEQSRIENMPFSPPGSDLLKLKSAYRESLLNLPHQFEDYVVDMHTREGRSVWKKTKVDFMAQGALVRYEDRQWFNPVWFANYVQRGIEGLAVASETDLYLLKGRAQLVTSRYKTDVYYAKERYGARRNVVVKGPYLNYAAAKWTIELQAIADLFTSVNSFNVDIKLLRPDMFVGSPLGLRTQTHAGQQQPCWFLICEDLFGQEEYKLISRSSKLWKNEPVVDPDQFRTGGRGGAPHGIAYPSELRSAGLVSLLLQLAWRWIFEIGDIVPRNLIYSGEKVYNIDTEGVNIGRTVYDTKQEEVALLRTKYNSCRDEITETLRGWQEQVPWSLIGKTVGRDPARFRENLDTLIKDFRGTLLPMYVRSSRSTVIYSSSFGPSSSTGICSLSSSLLSSSSFSSSSS